MSEVPLPYPQDGGLNTGDTIVLADMNELVAFEDVVARIINPVFDQAAWACRGPIGEIIRPKVEGHTFNGRIIDITLTAMDEPYARLIDAPTRGRATIKKKGGQLGETNELSGRHSVLMSEYRGFILQANAHSTGRGVIGKIHTEVWYAPLSPKVNAAGKVVHVKRTNAAGEEYTYTHT